MEETQKWNECLYNNLINTNIVPFVIDALRQGRSPRIFDGSSSTSNPHINNIGETSKEAGIILVAYSAAVVLGSIILGYIGELKSEEEHINVTVPYII